jgi:hypothetical protein
MKTNQELMNTLFETTRFDRTPGNWRSMPETEPLEKAALKAAPIPPSKKYVLENEAALAARLTAFFDRWAAKVAAMIAASEKVDLGLLLKSRSTDSLVKSIMKRLEAEGFLTGFADLLMSDLRAAASAGGFSGLAMISMSEDKRMTEVVPELAVKFSRARSGELIGMSYDEEKERFVKNPNAKMRITDATRDGVRRAVEKSLKEGLGVAEVKKTLTDDYAFSKTRAETIARTELANAHIQGSVEAWRESGVVEGKRWVLADTHPDSDECDEAVDEDVVPLDAVFEATGDIGPPAHPNCLCALQPVVSKS